VGRGADRILEQGAFRAEAYGSLVELMERQGGYRLTLFGKNDRDQLRRLLDRLDAEERPVLALGERAIA
jgi:hypothetical protein